MTTMPTLTSESADQALALAKRTVCVQFRCSVLGTKAKVRTSEVTDQVDSDRLAVNKDILRMPELKSITDLDGEMRLWLRKRSVTPEFISGGYYLIPTAMLAEVDDRMKWFVEERERLVARFYERYRDNRNEIIEQQRAHLGPVFNAAEYPTAERALEQFKVYQRYFAFDVPTSLKAVSTELYQREAQKQSAMWAEAHAEITTALRAEFQALVNHMADRLAVGVDGKPKVFRESLVPNFMEFLGTFPFRNVTNDGELAALVSRARDVLKGVDTSTLRENLGVRGQISGVFATIQAKLDTLVTDAPSRAISFE